MITANEQSNRYFIAGNENGKHNFSLQKSEYMPLFTTFDSGSALFGVRLGLNTAAYKSLNINRYMSAQENIHSSGSIDDYERTKKIFIKRVLELEKTLLHYDEKFLNDRHYLKDFKRFSYTRGFEGGKFRMGDYKFGGLPKTLLIGVDNGNHIIHYLFTFRTKYLKDLQIALIKGKAVKSHWFTVFITPNIPHVNTSRGYTKPFLERFIFPFEEAGIKIIYTDKILEQLSFTEVAPDFTFSFSSNQRSEKEIEMRNILSDFRKYELNKLQLQEDWDVGLASEDRFEQWKATLKIRFLTDKFIEYIDEMFYTGISLIDGMRRVFYLGDSVYDSQVYLAEKWIPIEDTFLELNDLEMGFSVFGNVPRESLPEANRVEFNKELVRVQDTLLGSTHDYSIRNEIIDFSSDSYFRISNYRATPMVLSADPPDTVIKNNITFYYDSSVGGYINNHNMQVSKFTEIRQFDSLHITTLIEFSNNKEAFPYSCNIYLWDVKALYSRKDGVLSIVTYTDSRYIQNYLMPLIASSIFYSAVGYNEDTVKRILTNNFPSLLTQGQGLITSDYYSLRIEGDGNDVLFSEGSSFRPEEGLHYAADYSNTSAPSITNVGAEADLPSMSDIAEEGVVRQRLTRRRGTTRINDLDLGVLPTLVNRQSDEEIREQQEAEAVAEMETRESDEEGERIRLAHAEDVAEAIAEENANAERDAENSSDEPDGSIFDVEPSNLENINTESHES